MRKLLKIASYPFIGLFFLIYSIANYELLGLKFILVKIKNVLKYIALGFIFICVFVMNIFKYAFYAVKIPFNLIGHKKEKKTPEIIPEDVSIVKDDSNDEITFEDETPQEEIKIEESQEKNDDSLDFTDVAPTNDKSVDDLLFDFIVKKNEELNSKKKKIKNEVKEEDSNIEFVSAPEDKNIINDSDTYLNKNIKIEKVTLGQRIKAFFAMIFGSLSKKSNKAFKNNIFAKNRRNKRDMNRQALLIDFEGEDAVKSAKKVIYQYIAKDQSGRIIKDYFDAYSKVEVHSYLLSEGYEVYSIKTNKWIQLMYAGSNSSRAKFKTKDLVFFLTQLSTYLKAGIPLVEALRIIARQYKKKTYKKIFKSVIYELSVGENLSAAMEKQGNAFPKLLVNMIKTAEMTGSLPEVLDDMADYYTEAEATRKQMITAMTYPSIVLVFSLGVMIFVMVYVVPRFVDIYDTLEGGLPTITKVVLAISSFLKNYWYLALAGVISLIVLFIVSYKKVKGFRTGVQYLLMHMPVFKNVIIYNEVTMFTKTFSSLLAHNVPITDSMEILNKLTNNEIYKMLILDTITNLARGGKISEAFKDHWAFPVPAYEMIVTGEATGELSEMMGKVSVYYQDLHKNAVTRIKTFIEPALTIFLTVGVGVILLSIIVPMFGMYSAVQSME